MTSDSPTKLLHIWWIKPNTLIAMAILPLYILIGVITKKLDNFNYWISFILIFCLYLGSQTLALSKIKKTRTITFCKKSSKTILNYLFIISLAGYFFWFSEIIKNPALLINALTTEGKIFSLRGVIETTPGLSTLSQFSVLYSAVYVKLVISKSIEPKGKYLFYFLTLLVMTIFRSWIWSERLALIEFLCPVIVIYLTSKNNSKKIHNSLRLFPIFGIFAVYLIFSIFEYFRSWQFYSKNESNFFGFTLERLTTYYSSSVANGIGFVSWQHDPSYDGSLLFSFFYRLPYIGEILRSTTIQSKTFSAYLNCCAEPEFNLASWPFLIVSDIGIPLSMIFFYLMGLIFSTAYKNFIASKSSFIYYPVIYVALLELMRQHYLHGPRFFYILIGAIFVHLFLKTKVQKKQTYDTFMEVAK